MVLQYLTDPDTFVLLCGCPALGGTRDAKREWRFVFPHHKWWATDGLLGWIITAKP
jgi:hypothetical protein